MSKVKILIVEDDPILQQVYEEALPEEEYEKKLTSNGFNALKIYESWNPNIIILDLGLEELNGYFMLRKIRKYFKDEDTTIIIATGVSEKSSILGCIKLGISAYIVKPFKYEEINRIVKKAYKSGKMTITSAL
jgi:DNA-binding response OmpR family regulator